MSQLDEIRARIPDIPEADMSRSEKDRAYLLNVIDRQQEIGYVCRHGHFQFNDDPDGDSCGTKIVGRIFVAPEPEISAAELAEAIDDSLQSHHRKMEEWRKA